MCDQCQRWPVSTSSGIFHCAICDYDLCPNCYGGGRETPMRNLFLPKGFRPGGDKDILPESIQYMTDSSDEFMNEDIGDLYSGRIFKYNYGYEKDFVERYLILSGGFIQYYRNEGHYHSQRSLIEPIVKVPFKSVAWVNRLPIVNEAIRKKQPYH